MSTFFKDLKIIELASVLAGPAVGMFFAELGAEVVKIENKKTEGDVTRNWRLPGESARGPGAYFSSVNHKKRHLLLDFTLPGDLELLRKEIQLADMVISNFSERVSHKFNLNYKSLSKSNRRLIYLQLDGYVNEDRPAYDVVLQAETGWISMTGTQKDEPSKLPVALIDVIAGHQLKEAALLSLLKLERTGEGSYVRCTLEESSLSALVNQASNYLMEGAVARPIGTRHPNIAPYGDWFQTRDGVRFVLAVGSDVQFFELCQLLGMESRKEFANNQERVAHRKELNRALSGKISVRYFDELASELSKANIPFGKIKTLDEVLSSPAALTMLREEEIEGVMTRRLSGIGFTTSFLDSGSGETE